MIMTCVCAMRCTARSIHTLLPPPAQRRAATFTRRSCCKLSCNSLDLSSLFCRCCCRSLFCCSLLLLSSATTAADDEEEEEATLSGFLSLRNLPTWRLASCEQSGKYSSNATAHKRLNRKQQTKKTSFKRVAVRAGSAG